MWFVLAFACMGWVLNQLICSACVVVLGRLADCMHVVSTLACKAAVRFHPPGQYLLQYFFCKSIPCYDCTMLPALKPLLSPKQCWYWCACPYTGHVGTICMERSACLLNLKSINLCLWAIVPGDGAGGWCIPKLASVLRLQADIQNRVAACVIIRCACRYIATPVLLNV